MKKNCILAIMAVFFATNIMAQIEVKTDGNILVGDVPGYSTSHKLNVNGKAWIGTYTGHTPTHQLTVNGKMWVGSFSGQNPSQKFTVNGKVWFGTYTGYSPQYDFTLNGKAWIGNYAGQTKNHELSINGYANFLCPNSTGGLLLEDYYNYQTSSGTKGYVHDPILKPQKNMTGFIGKRGNEFYKIYSYKIYTYDGRVISYSDENIKENIRLYENKSLTDKLSAVNVYSFDYKAELYDSVTDSVRLAYLLENRKDKIGFIAQNLQESFPEFVEYDNESELYTISQTSLIPILVQVSKDQQTEIDKHQKKIKKLKNENEEQQITLENQQETIESLKEQMEQMQEQLQNLIEQLEDDDDDDKNTGEENNNETQTE